MYRGFWFAMIGAVGINESGLLDVEGPLCIISCRLSLVHEMANFTEVSSFRESTKASAS